MNRSRHIAFILLFTAALVMILNTVRPHHHHHNQVCFTTVHCEDEESCDSAADSDQHGWDHQHGHPINELCKINGYCLVPDSKNHAVKILPGNSHKTITLLAIYSVDPVIKQAMTGIPPEGSSNERIRQSVKSLLHALRAPPSC